MSFDSGAAHSASPLANATSAAGCAVVIPCLNEVQRIGGLVRETLQHISTIVVVDDGSSDGTGGAAASAGAIVMRHEHPRGKGSALRTGFCEAAERGAAWALAMDGDGQHAPADIPKFLERIDEGVPGLRVGNRMASPGSMPLCRRAVNRWMSGRLSRFCGQPLPDSQCGFRLVHLESWRGLNVRAEHFEIESELLVRFLWAGLAVDFVPIETRYGGERSKIRPIRDAVRWFRWWRRIRAELDGSPRRAHSLMQSKEYGRIIRNAAA